MKKRKTKTIILAVGLLFVIGIFISNYSHSAIKSRFKVGSSIDNFNGVFVYYNGLVGNVKGRNVSKDGYNLGLKHQCVEFVKRYYYEHLNHKMPYSYGHAKDFFSFGLKDGQKNKKRNLNQYSNPSSKLPRIDDLIVFDKSIFNKFGHVAIISNVTENEVEIIQQNPGPISNSREKYKLVKKDNKWVINNSRILGWLRKE
jgi:hypothetical protein